MAHAGPDTAGLSGASRRGDSERGLFGASREPGREKSRLPSGPQPVVLAKGLGERSKKALWLGGSGGWWRGLVVGGNGEPEKGQDDRLV